MATSIKISQLPAKGSNLEATDLLEVSEFNGTGYVSKSITGAEIVGGVVTEFVPNTRTISTTTPLNGGGDLTADRTLSIPQATTSVDGYLSATDWNKFNNKVASFKNGNNGATVSNTTTITPTYTQLIPANTYGAGDVVEVMTRVFTTITKITPSSMYIYLNTTPDLFGSPIQVGIVTATQRTLQMERTLAIKGATTRVPSSGVSAGQDFALSGTATLLTIDWTINQYFVFAVGHSVASPTEIYTGDFYRILKN
jgi:hypothetical protein